MSEWRYSTWGAEISLEYGKALRNYDSEKGLYRVFGSNGPIGWTSHALTDGPGIILGRKGAYRGVQYSHDPFFVIDTAYYVVPKTELHMRWLYYAIKYHKLGEIDDGSPIPSTTRSAVYVREIEIPPLEEQRAIAHILGSLDDKIELNRRMNETVEAMARAIFKEWFVDFGPVRAKMEGREPDGLAPDIAALFPDALDDEGKPVGWAKNRVEDVLELAYGKALKATDRNLGDVPVYGSGGITGYHNQALINEPSIIVGRKGTVGSLYWEDRPFFPIDTVFYVNAKVPLTFCFYLLQSLGLEHMNTDAAVPGLNRNNVYRLSVISELETIVPLFDKTIKPLRSQIFHNLQESQTLAELRDVLLPKLISGEIRVSDLDTVPVSAYSEHESHE